MRRWRNRHSTPHVTPMEHTDVVKWCVNELFPLVDSMLRGDLKQSQTFTLVNDLTVDVNVREHGVQIITDEIRIYDQLKVKYRSAQAELVGSGWIYIPWPAQTRTN